MPDTPIEISPSMYLIIQGQLGNIIAKLQGLQRVAIDNELVGFIPIIEEVVEEVRIMQRYMPLDPKALQDPGNVSKKDEENE